MLTPYIHIMNHISNRKHPLSILKNLISAAMIVFHLPFVESMILHYTVNRHNLMKCNFGASWNIIFNVV